MSYYGLRGSSLKIIEPEVMACNLPLRLDPYLSCAHNCTYCYARSQKTFRRLWKPDAVKSIDTSRLERHISKVLKSPKPPPNSLDRALWYRFPIRIGTDTDAFQPCERQSMVTKRILEILNRYSYPYIINTKSDMVAEDEYMHLLKNSPAGAVVQFTVISLDEELIKKIEPGAPPIGKRLEAMRILASNNIYIQTRVSPIIPELTDRLEDMHELFRTLKKAGTRDIIVEYLRYSIGNMANPFIREWMSSALQVQPTYIDGIYSRAYRECSKTFPDCCKRNRARFGCEWDGRPKVKSGYIRMPLRLKLEKYRKFKSEAEKEGLRLYVCSEEFPEINECVNCCGIKGAEAGRYLRFKYDNEACANTLPCLIRDKKDLSLNDVLESMFSIDKNIFEKQFANLDKYLVNVKKTPSGKWVYDENFPI